MSVNRVSQVLRDGAKKIADRGHAKGALEGSGGAVCLIGSLAMVDRIRAVMGQGRAHDYMSRAIGDLYGFEVPFGSHVGKWNDLPSTTAQMAVEVLEYASKLAVADELG